MDRTYASIIAALIVLLSNGFVSAAPRTAENAAWNVNFNANTTDPKQYYGEWPGHRYHPSPADWRDVAVYQFITDRFRDGDPTNNDGKYGGYNLYDVGARHGGDFKGVKETLPYIKSLGFDGIWISPVFQNRYNSYHGYAQIDFTLLDDRFGTVQDFRELTDEAHRLGMYVIVDIVVNHMDNLYYFKEPGPDGPVMHHGAPFRLHDREYELVLRNPDESYADFKHDNTFHPHGTYSDVYGYDGYKKRDEWGQGSYWFSDFHHNGDIGSYDDPWQNHLGKIYGIMDDLRTTHPNVQEKLIAMTKALISSVDVDGIRMDTPMQVPLYFFKQWAPAVKAHARSLGKDNFFIFGEFYCPRERSATMVGRGRTPDQWGQPYLFIDEVPTMDAGINYDFYFKFVGPAIKAQEGGVANAMQQFKEDMRAYDFYNPDRSSVRYTMLNFYNNHDQWRLNWEHDGFRKTRLASSVIAFWPGIPLFYYGDEQGLATEGSALDGNSREDFMTSKAWWDRPSRSPVNPAVFDNFNMTHSDYRHVQRMMNVRKQYFALRNTDEIYERWAQTNNTNGIYAFTRVWGSQKDWVLVAFNTWRDRLEAGGAQGPFYTGWNEGDRIVNVLNPSERYQLGRDGTLASLWLDGYETKVLVREDNLQPLQPVVEATEPSHDEVTQMGRRTVVVRFSEPMQEDSVRHALVFDGNPVPADRLRFSDGSRTVSFDTDVTGGIHKLEVAPSATSLHGKPLLAAFHSRFRAGADANPIVKLQKDFLEADGLATVATTASGTRELVFRHKAAGAEKFRVTLDQGRSWSAWQTYAERTSLPIGENERPEEVWAQYWADGSAAYFVRGRIGQ